MNVHPRRGMRAFDSRFQCGSLRAESLKARKPNCHVPESQLLYSNREHIQAIFLRPLVIILIAAIEDHLGAQLLR
jgi:hypothetical protein